MSATDDGLSTTVDGLSAADDGLHAADNEMQAADDGLGAANDGLRPADNGLRLADDGLRNFDVGEEFGSVSIYLAAAADDEVMEGRADPSVAACEERVVGQGGKRRPGVLGEAG